MSVRPQSDGPSGPKQFKYLSLLMMCFVVGLLTANVTSAKLVQLGPIVVAGGTLFFPITFLISDTLTEVYGFKATRRTIWWGFGALLFMTLGTLGIQLAPHPEFWTNQKAYEDILGVLWRTNLAGLVAYLFGEFMNSITMVLMKRRAMAAGPDSDGYHNKGMATRFILSTVVGQFFDSVLFVTIAFYGVVPNDQLLVMFVSGWSVKVLWEVIALPISTRVVARIKRIEHQDADSRGESLSPI